MRVNNKIFIAVLVVCVGLFSYTAYKGRQQVDKRQADYEKYLSVQERIESETDLNNALNDLNYITNDYYETDVLSYDKAVLYQKLKKYDKAQESLEKSMKLNPKVAENVGILAMYGDILYENKDTEKAKEVLDKIKTLDIQESEKDKVNELIKKLG
ncbi:tetratricopeptide repeat protein [Romboutsia lituseburensis]|uniref:Tetratricopeptide repeat-containing protein n=1 Tax=Romboutsia lituseburensis DSM 797 TaxID=1121325 RepID=A0A1G9QPX0_9FIRM|nr:tetratricopeptide repeat protein [Romboutsia lituseburensis]CEH35627.1 Tetratricopeptide repeat [Romboutsia lituseburensis]SDM13092.1 Tetratricopeptide repeat-containing protein [Romboutsia lituseburensis DSM 797]